MTSPDDWLPPRQAQAEILGSSLAEYSEWTLCARFKTFRFSTYPDISYHYLISVGEIPLLASYVAEECEHRHPGCTQYYKEKYGVVWRLGTVRGYVRYGRDFHHFPAWLRGLWTSLCISTDQVNRRHSIRINEELVFENKEYNGTYQNIDKNLVLMNDDGHHSGYPMHGSLTDLQVWSRSLTEVEMSDWARCKSGAAGDVIDWRTAELNITQLQQQNVSRAETCYQEGDQDKYLAFEPKKDFDETAQFCKNLGGMMAVAVDQDTTDLMNESFVSSGKAGGFYTGYTDREVEDVWVDVNEKKPITWPNWDVGEPNNWGSNQNCAVFGTFQHPLHVDDVECYYKYFPVCKLPEFRRSRHFVIRGICKESSMDRFYVMKTAKELVGLIQDRIVYSESSGRWEVLSYNGEVRG